MRTRHKNELVALRLCLLRLQKGPIPIKEEGICDNVNTVSLHEPYFIIPVRKAVMEEACKGWEHFSGSTMFPIKHPTEKPHEGYHWGGNLWDRRTQYGKRRYELVGRMLDVIERQLSILS